MIAGIQSYQSGSPLRISTTNSLPIFNGHLRPNLIAGVPIRIGPERGGFEPLNGLSGQQGDLFLNRAAFAAPAAFTLGNLGVFLPDVRSFGSRNEDLSLVKRFKLIESISTEFRADFFNAFNRRNLNAPVVDLTNPNFGRVAGQGGARVLQLGWRLEF
jgi:hypothetical protein